MWTVIYRSEVKEKYHDLNDIPLNNRSDWHVKPDNFLNGDDIDVAEDRWTSPSVKPSDFIGKTKEEIPQVIVPGTFQLVSESSSSSIEPEICGDVVPFLETFKAIRMLSKKIICECTVTEKVEMLIYDYIPHPKGKYIKIQTVKPDGTNGIIVFTVLGGIINSVSIDTPGSDYENGSYTLYIKQEIDSGGSINYTITNGSISSVSINDPGSNHTDGSYTIIPDHLRKEHRFIPYDLVSSYPTTFSLSDVSEEEYYYLRYYIPLYLKEEDVNSSSSSSSKEVNIARWEKVSEQRYHRSDDSCVFRNIITSLDGVTIRNDLTFMLSTYLGIEINEKLNTYIPLFDASTAGSIQDDNNPFQGVYDNSDTKIDDGFVRITINGSYYYINKFVGADFLETCSELNGSEDHDSIFTLAGYVLINLNDTDSKYIEVYTKQEEASSSSSL